MSFKTRISLLLTFLVGVLLLSSGVTAEKQSLEHRFDSRDNDKVTKEEQLGDYNFDKAHSSINFRVRHMGLVDVPGSFRKFSGKISFDPADKASNSKVEFKAEVNSIDTGIDRRDNHLRSKDFFEVATYPEMEFKSSEIKKNGKYHTVKGNLTMKGVTKPVELQMQMFGPIKDQRGNIRMGVSGTTSINRRDFNVNYGGNLPNGTPVLSDNIVVDIQIEAVKRAAKKQ